MLQDLSIVRRYAEKVEVLANPNELFQVFVNLMTHAIHAMDGRGTLTLSSCCENGAERFQSPILVVAYPQKILKKSLTHFSPPNRQKKEQG